MSLFSKKSIGKRLKVKAPIKYQKAYKPNEPDKLYLVLVRINKSNWFHTLFYNLNIKSLDELKVALADVTNEIHKKLLFWDHTVRQKFEEHVRAVQQDGFRIVEERDGVKLNDYEEQMRASGVTMIKRSELSNLRRLASGPYSGEVFAADWMKPDGQKEVVCLRHTWETYQPAMFLNEAKAMATLQHENLLGIHGACVPGRYTPSIALIVEYCVYGHLEESVPFNMFTLITVETVCQFAQQLAEALAYLKNKGLVHESLEGFFVYVASLKQVKLGALSFCVTEGQTNKDVVLERHTRLYAAEVSRRRENTEKDTVSSYIHIVTNMFNSLSFAMSSDSVKACSLAMKNSAEPFLCPDQIRPLMEKSKSASPDDRPTYQEIAQTLAQCISQRACAIVGYERKAAHELSYKKGDRIVIISQNMERCRGMWFGQKDREVGFFSPDNVVLVETGQDEVPPEIKARGPEAELAYRKALLDGKLQVYRGRIMLVGQDRAGKTSLKNSLLGLPFNPREQSTIGVEVDPSMFEVDVEQTSEWKRLDGNTTLLSKFERYIARLVAENLTQATSQQQNAKSKESEGQARRLSEEAYSSDEIVYNAPSLDDSQTESYSVTGPKATHDIKGSRISGSKDTDVNVPDDIANLVAEYLSNLELQDDTQKKETVIDIWDFAGQHVYYATHPIFFTSRGIYLVVYNLSKPLDAPAQPCVRQGTHDISLDNASGETNLQNLESWLVSIHSIRTGSDRSTQPQMNSDLPGKKSYLAPPVLLVGTHADQSWQKSADVKKHLARTIEKKAYEKHVIRKFFEVDNSLSSSDKGVQELRNKIAEILNMEPYMGETLPAKWLHFEKEVKILTEQGIHYLKTEQVKEIARQKCFITCGSELTTVLNFYHDLGVITHYGNTVVLKTQWLIDLLKKLITVRPYHEQEPLYAEFWRELEETGVLRGALIDHIFGQLMSEKLPQSDILSMMEMYGLVARFSTRAPGQDSVECGDVSYLVPAQLMVSPKELLEIVPQEDDPCPLFIRFRDGFVPHGVFTQVVARLIKWCCEHGCTKQPNLYRGAARFILGDSNQYDLVLLCCKMTIKVTLVTVNPAENDHKPDLLPVQVRCCLEEILKKLTHDCCWLGNMSYDFCITCSSCAEEKSPSTSPVDSSTTNDECFHFLPLYAGTPCVCTKSFGMKSRIVPPGVENWFTVSKGEESADDLCSVDGRSKIRPASGFSKQDNHPPKGVTFKPGEPNRDDLLRLAQEIGQQWKALGRVLGHTEPDLEHIEADQSSLFERSYSSLRKWIQAKGSRASYEELGKALCHSAIGKGELAVVYCTVGKAVDSEM